MDGIHDFHLGKSYKITVTSLTAKLLEWEECDEVSNDPTYPPIRHRFISPEEKPAITP